ncbi:MAG: hypothetical protein ABSA47_15140 [Verrucomicrobiota bacterium]
MNDPLQLESESTREEPSEYRLAAERFMEFSDQRGMFIMGYRKNRMLAYEATLLAMGKFHILSLTTTTQLAQRYVVTQLRSRMFAVWLLTGRQQASSPVNAPSPVLGLLCRIADLPDGSAHMPAISPTTNE